MNLKRLSLLTIMLCFATALASAGLPPINIEEDVDASSGGCADGSVMVEETTLIEETEETSAEETVIEEINIVDVEIELIKVEETTSEDNVSEKIADELTSEEKIAMEEKVEPFSLAASGGKWTQDDEMGVAVTKEIMPNENGTCPDVKLTVQMPHYEYGMSVILAIDTSGSMRQICSADSSEGDWINESVAALLGEDFFRENETKLAIVSWDSDVDFSTDMFSLVENGAEASESLENLESLETETTIYDVGLREAVHVLKKNPPKDPANTKEIIIFVTGLSEFNPGARLDDTIFEAAKSGYEVYSIGLGINPTSGPMQYSTLEQMANETGGVFYSTEEESLAGLSEIVAAIYNEIDGRPIATEMVLTDTLFSVLEVEETAPFAETSENSDKTTSLRWDVGGMKKDETKTFVAHTTLQIKISADPEESVSVSDESDPESALTYKWHTGEERLIEVPTGEIHITCQDQE